MTGAPIGGHEWRRGRRPLAGAPDGVRELAPDLARHVIGSPLDFPVLVDEGDDDARRVLGWYYGYSACCVEAWLDRAADPATYAPQQAWSDALDAAIAARQAWGDRHPDRELDPDDLYDAAPLDDPADPWPALPPYPAPPQVARHPVSGHLLCAACASGEPAPLPDRPAARYGWLFPPDDDGRVRLDPPHPHGAHAPTSMYAPPLDDAEAGAA